MKTLLNVAVGVIGLLFLFPMIAVFGHYFLNPTLAAYEPYLRATVLLGLIVGTLVLAWIKAFKLTWTMFSEVVLATACLMMVATAVVVVLPSLAGDDASTGPFAGVLAELRPLNFVIVGGAFSLSTGVLVALSSCFLTRLATTWVERWLRAQRSAN